MLVLQQAASVRVYHTHSHTACQTYTLTVKPLSEFSVLSCLPSTETISQFRRENKNLEERVCCVPRYKHQSELEKTFRIIQETNKSCPYFLNYGKYFPPTCILTNVGIYVMSEVAEVTKSDRIYQFIALSAAVKHKSMASLY